MISFEAVKEKVEELGYEIELKTNAVLRFYIKCKNGVVSYYPKDDIWVSEKNNPSIGIDKMLWYLKENTGRLRPNSKMPLREFLCMMAFAAVICEDYSVEDYGYKTWSELYDYVVSNKVNKLYTTWRKEAHWINEASSNTTCLYEDTLYELLQEEYDRVERMLNCVKAYNVEF